MSTEHLSGSGVSVAAARSGAVESVPSGAAGGPRIDYRLSREAYDALPRLNWSRLKHLAKSPAHFRHACQYALEDSDARRMGRARHVAILEPSRFAEEFQVWRGGDKRKHAKEWAEFKLTHGEGCILSEEEAAECARIQDAVWSDPVAARYLEAGRPEVTVTWESHGHPLKARLDFLNPMIGAVVEVKTTKDASPTGFPREVARYSHHAQIAMQGDGVQSVAGGEELKRVIVAAENVEPFAVTVYALPEAVVDAGRRHYLSLLERLTWCQRADQWPGYASSEVELMLPVWAEGAADGI